MLNLSLEIEQSLSTRPDFSMYTEMDIRHASISLCRYEIDSMGELRNTKSAIGTSLPTIYGGAKTSITLTIKCFCGIFDSSPMANRNRGGANFIDGISIPQKISPYKIDLPMIGGSIRPGRNTVNAISRTTLNRFIGRSRFSTLYISIWQRNRGGHLSSNAKGLSRLGGMPFVIIRTRNMIRFNNILSIDCGAFSLPISHMLSILLSERSPNSIISGFY